MRVEQLAVDDVSVKGTSASVTTSVYEFAGRQWVTTHPDIERARVGPVTMPSGTAPDDGPPSVVLGTRSLRTEGAVDSLRISFETPWVLDPWALYALVLPSAFVPHEALMEAQDGTRLDLEHGATVEGRLFLYRVVMEAETVRITALLRKDEGEADRAVKSTGVVRGTERYRSFARSVARETARPDTLLRILDLGSKLHL